MSGRKLTLKQHWKVFVTRLRAAWIVFNADAYMAVTFTDDGAVLDISSPRCSMSRHESFDALAEAIAAAHRARLESSMSDRERLFHVCNVARVIAADAILRAFDTGLVAWEDYPELPEGVWAEISVRIRRDAYRMATMEDYGESYGALAALAEEV